MQPFFLFTTLVLNVSVALAAQEPPAATASSKASPESSVSPASATLTFTMIEPQKEAEKEAPPAIVSQLEDATKGLQMPSETDAPFRVVFYPFSAELTTELTTEKADEPKTEPEKEKNREKPGDEAEKPKSDAKLTLQAIGKLVGAPAEAKLETRELDDFFDAPASEDDWKDEAELASAKRFAALRDLLQTALQNVQVVLWGDAEKQVAIIGTVEGGAAGVLTFIVET